jgi:hypothetical protein
MHDSNKSCSRQRIGNVFKSSCYQSARLGVFLCVCYLNRNHGWIRRDSYSIRSPGPLIVQGLRAELADPEAYSSKPGCWRPVFSGIKARDLMTLCSHNCGLLLRALTTTRPDTWQLYCSP